MLPHLLVIEDSDEDYEAFRRILRKLAFPHPIYRCVNGEEGLDYLNQTVKRLQTRCLQHPKLILLDLNLPGTSGQEVLDEIKNNEILKPIPVVIFTTSSNPKDIAICYQKGISGYLVKPINLQMLVKSVEILLAYWFEAIALPSDFCS